MVSAVLAELLAARRPVLNQHVAQARRRWPSLDTAAFSAFVAQTLDPLCVAVARVDPAAVQPVGELAFELGLDLVGQGLAGPAARLPWVDQAWQRLAPAAAALLVQAPRETLGAISNAVLRLADVSGARVDAWIDAMAALAPGCRSVAQFRAVGALCAWRAGMAQLRRPALEQGDRLPAALAVAALGGEGDDWGMLRGRFEADRWWHPGMTGADRRGWTVGGFTGLGGPFAVPPRLRAVADGFVAESAGRCFLLMADAFGAVVLPASAEEFAAGSETPAEVPAGAAALRRADGSDDAGPAAAAAAAAVDFAPRGSVRAVAGGAGVALCSPLSHHVRLLPGMP
ncbi:hypothetical protein [Xanthomonas sp. XNM01]|uniref:hypothetical protein n=1 Tax=Xanthomonas sp. XNM01 TaxID=2769289 RepID=UPI0017812439|nr:hypothetical protein [Xanthomonas sp. XNM01]MBD9369007.1 hypothetical protein [Xanthomonas sp. XNM01]